jgi:hypothetical protein
VSDEQAAAAHREPAGLTAEVGAAGVKRIVSERSQVAGRGDLVGVAIVVVDVRVLRSDGGRSGLAILILAVDLVVS